MSLQDQLAATSAPAWIPAAKGDMLCGRVVGRSGRTTDFGEYEIITIDPRLDGGCATVNGSADFTVKTAEGDASYTGGPLAWHAMGGVAINEVESRDPRPGDGCGVLFDGTGIAQSGVGKGRSYKIFRVVVEKATPVAPVATPTPAELPLTPAPAVAPSASGEPQIAADYPTYDDEFEAPF